MERLKFKLLNGALDRKVERVIRGIEAMVKDVAADEPGNYFNDLYVQRTELLQRHQLKNLLAR